MIKLNHRIYKILYCFLLIAGCFGHSYGEKKNTIDFKISYLLDSASNSTFDKVIASKKFSALPTKTLDIGFAKSAIWLSLELQKANEDLILTLENCHLDSLDIYLFSNDQLTQKIQSGDHLPFNTRYLNNNFFNFKINEGTTKILIRVRTQGMTTVPVKLFNFINYYDYYESFARFHWIYFGLVILVILSNILFYLWLREPIYLYYIFCVLGIGIVTAVDFEYTFQFIWPETPSLNLFTPAYYSFFVFTIIFTDKLLSVRKNLPRVYPLFIVYYIVAASMILLTFFGQYNVAVRLLLYVSPLMPILCLISGILILLKQGDHVVKFYLIGWTLYFVCMFLYIVMWMGFIPLNIFTLNLLPIGSSFEIVFLNLAILSKINVLKQEKENILSEQNKILEIKVGHRTTELQEKNDEILAQNEEMINQQMEMEAQRDTLENQNRIIEEQNILLKGSKESLEKLVEIRTDELQLTNQELVDYNHRLEQFAFVTAHNLRGPVATLLGLAQIYNKKDISDPVNLTILERSNETTLKLDSIIKDLVGILDLQKNSSALIQSIDINNVFNDVRILLLKEIEESKAIVRHNFDPTTNISCVSAYINNIFYNLISNAIKYRREGITSVINIEYIMENDNVRLNFIDNGRGIDLEKFGDKLFHPYKRFHLDKEGKGLGLYIVKTQVEIMKGTITLTSEPDKGSCFSILLPVKKN
jgi:signal transduction histidine kinase